MPAARDVGVDAILAIGSTSVYANLSGTSVDFNRASQPIIVATGTGNSMIGHAPSTGAKSGFRVTFDLPITGAATLLNAMLGSGGVDITLYLGTAGGSKVLTCFCTDLQVTGAEGGNITVSATFDAINLPTVTPAAPTTPTGDVWKFVDVTSVTLVSGTVYTDVTRFSWRVQRKLAAFKGNSPSGIAKYLKKVRTESMLDAEVLKVGDGEGTAAIGSCPTIHDCSIALAQVCQLDGTPGVATLTLSTLAAFYPAFPTTPSATEDWILESCAAVGNLGGFAAA